MISPICGQCIKERKSAIQTALIHTRGYDPKADENDIEASLNPAMEQCD